MSRTPQDVYASNLLREQSFGYPLRDPTSQSSNLEGCQIGDVGYVDALGEFKVVLNICSSVEEQQGRALGFDIDQPYAKPAFDARQVFMAGVVRKNLVVEAPRYIHITVGASYVLFDILRAGYEFTTTTGEGAILILPDGAILSELQDREQLKNIRKHAEKYASQWCQIAGRNSLYLITAVYRSKSWTLGSFERGTPDKKILVHRQSCDSSRTGPMYEWNYEINVVHKQGPANNSYVNQTVFIKGFNMTVRRGSLPIVEWAERTQSWFSRVLIALCSTLLREEWMTQTRGS